MAVGTSRRGEGKTAKDGPELSQMYRILTKRKNKCYEREDRRFNETDNKVLPHTQLDTRTTTKQKRLKTEEGM